MPDPEDKKGLQRFFGMVRYLAQYIPGEAEITAPLRKLLCKDILWQWGPEHAKAVQSLKQALIEAPVLQFFDPTKAVVIQADASKSGLGACLLQDNCPIAYASRAMTTTEQNYAQIEKELLAIVYATKKFHQFVFGKTVTVQSDHKPLEAILTKPLSKAPARLQRMLLQLQRYDLEIVYTPGRDMHISDALSRATVDPPEQEEDMLSEERVVYTLSVSETIGADMLSYLQTSTAEDADLSAIKEILSQGWPQRKKQLRLSLQPFWQCKHLLRMEDALLLLGDKIVVPQNARRKILDSLHECHQGIQRTKMQARMILFWPSMSKDIQHMVETCKICASHQPANQKELLLSHTIPHLPWQKLAADIFEWRGASFLVVVDYFSKYPEVLKLSDKSALSVIGKLKETFSRHGIPTEIICDHVPFASAEVKDFAAKWGIKFTHSSPGYPQSNGLAERTVKTIKLVLQEAWESGVDPHIGLLELRNTPVTGMAYSPAQLLMGRVLRTKLPVVAAALQPRIPQHAHQQLRKLQRRQKVYYDHGAKSLPPFHKGDAVLMETTAGWQPATISSIGPEPRSYVVARPDGRKYRRNR
uniref:Gypsy retrotransposon integrase-like protein 1 n=1 Tax=Leptobrachium leishanense TaxID=445787 RepID=A0A8C5M1Z9_9ANUR